ncbi:unnamed protein product [Brassica napus]|uniref:(rape) hypothetical protein n=1 Tax=Brassica napus TaxID=3708 RepID=A0A816TQQ0_BRANA|nr:unnamed protein product [Brassica napus]
MATANEPTPQEVVFDDLNYEAWAPIMKATLVERGLWDVVENVAPLNPLSMPELAATIQAKDVSPWRDFAVKNTKAIHILQCSVPDSVFRQTLHAASAKDLWDLLQESNEQAKLQKDFEQLQIDFRERFSSYIDRVTFINGSTVEAQGIGDVRIVTREGKMKTIKDVLYVPGIVASVLSVGQMNKCGYVTGIPTDPSKNPDLAATLEVEELCRWRELVRQDMKALQILQSSLPDSLFRKTLSATSAKELWEMLEQVPEHVSYALYRTDVTYDANMWMVYTTTTNHMTPHEKYFTALDRTRKARVTFINGSSVMAQGTGDVRVVTKEGKVKTIKDVLYVPGIVANALSVGQLSRNGYDVKMGTELVTIRDRVTGLVFGEAKWAENIGFFLRFEVV